MQTPTSEYYFCRAVTSQVLCETTASFPKLDPISLPPWLSNSVVDLCALYRFFVLQGSCTKEQEFFEVFLLAPRLCSGKAVIMFSVTYAFITLR